MRVESSGEPLIPDSRSPAHSTPHMPRCAALHEEQEPGSDDAGDADDARTAKTDNSFSTCGLAHCLQTTSVEDEGTIFSNLAPQARHLYSKSGIRTSCKEYSQSPASLQLLPLQGLEFGGVAACGHDGRCIFCGFLLDGHG
jgi:hypothetical protein